MQFNRNNRPIDKQKQTSAKLSRLMSERLKNQVELSNDETHHHTRVDRNKAELIDQMMSNGYVSGNHTARWRKEGYIRKYPGQGYYWKPDSTGK